MYEPGIFEVGLENGAEVMERAWQWDGGWSINMFKEPGSEEEDYLLRVGWAAEP